LRDIAKKERERERKRGGRGRRHEKKVRKGVSEKQIY